MNIQDVINALSENPEGFRNTELRVVYKGGGTRPIAYATLQNGYLFLAPDHDANKHEIEVTNG